MPEWVRLYHDTPTDPKWRVIARKSGQRIGDVLAVWNFILTNASANANERGRTHNFNSEDVAAALDLETTDVEAIVAAMENKVIKNGFLTAWEKRNPIKDDGAAERAKRWRERKRTQANGANALETDRDTDTSSLRSDVGASQAKPPPKRKPKRALPDGFPEKPDLEWARQKWLTRGRADLCERMDDEVQKFRDHHSGRDTRSADWPASWRTWTQNAMNFSKVSKNGTGNYHGSGKRAGSHDAHLQALAELAGGTDG